MFNMEKQQENSSEQNNSMEELKMEEDEYVKEVSMEDDILGAQSLLLSESDEDLNDGNSFGNKSPEKRTCPKRSKRILDSDSEDDVENKLLGVQANGKEKLTNEKLLTLFDSNSDVEQNKPKDEEKKLSNKLNNEIDFDIEAGENTNKEEKLRNKKISSLIDSDSDIDNNGPMNEDEEFSTKFNKEINSNEEASGNVKVNLNQLKQELKKSKLNKKKKELKNTLHKTNSDSDSDSPKTYTFEKSKKKKKNSKNKTNSDTEDTQDKLNNTKKKLSLVDSESSDAGSESGNNASDLEASARDANFEKNKSNSKNTDQKLKVVRASAKKAIDEMKAIQSEQQRLHREAHLSIPYHKPRKHTLDEFLKRRTIIQPHLASPVAAAIQTKSLKMTPEELEEYAKLMEERAKEATEFFKSESENEEEVVLKDNEGVLDKTVETSDQNCVNISMKTLELPNKIEMEEIAKADDNTTNMLTENLDDVQLTEEELAAILVEEEQMPQVEEEEEEERPRCSKVLITEVIELPKLDMNTVRISPVKKQTPRSSLNIKKLLGEKNLTESPTLSGDPNKLIDLETGDLIDKKPSGIENLMKRLMSSVKLRKSKTSETCNILSVENGVLEMSKVNISRTETKDVQKEAKPGAAHLELKNSLFNIIKKKRLEQLNKKEEDELEYSKCLADDDDEDNYGMEEDEIEEIYLEDEQDVKHDNKVVMVDEDENAIMVEVDGDDNAEVEISGDEEDVENDNGEHDEDDDDDDDDDGNDDEGDVEEVEESEEENNDNKNIETIDKSQRKSRIIKAFDDTDEEEGENDDIDFLKTQPPTTQPSLLESQATVKTSLENEENELMALCSGTFEDTQKTCINALMSQIPITQNSGKPGNDEELMKLCSGTFDQPSDTPQPTQFPASSENLKTKSNKILSSDEENDEEQLNDNEKNKQRNKKLTKKLAKRKAKLGFSDDEDDEKEEEGEEGENDEDDRQMEVLDDNIEIDTEEPETFIDYDSEENEILVQMTKKDKLKQAQNFVENEAELSESEWGSADEDENNLDKYDIELGDEDEFDREKLQRELGQIHARKMLDEDIREVRKLQEMFFEDEEKDGVGRQRTFKWKNAESGFSLDDGRPLDETGENGDSGDEMNEHQWRKIRYEREQFLKEHGVKLDSQVISPVLNNTTAIQLNSTANSATTTKKLQIATKKTVLSTSGSKSSSPFLISKGISAMHRKSVRGSFLVRDKDTLNKLAGLTKGTSTSIAVSEMDDTAGTVSIKSIKPKNFVFATLTEEEHENLKRKADDLLNSSNENGINFMKKPKTEPRRNKCFIDQLL